MEEARILTLLFLIPPHNHGINPSAPTQAGAHVENAENAQEEEARNPVPIDDRKDTLDVATDPKDDHELAATYSDHHPRPRLTTATTPSTTTSTSTCTSRGTSTSIALA